jgi:N-acyl-D-amino-acid deacylase
MHADIAVFEPDAVIDSATYDEPRSLALGMRHVLVNGVPTIEDERYEPRASGRAVRRSERAL